QGKREDFHGNKNTISLDKESFQRRKLTGRRGVNVIDDGRRHIQTLPAGKPATKAKIRVVSVGKEVLVEQADHFKHLAAIERSSGIREKNFLALIKLPPIRFPRPSSVIQAI